MSDEVSQFLEQVERLRGQQIEEDETRARELEEYLAAKRERQARREGEKITKKTKKEKERGSLGVHCCLQLDSHPRGFVACIDGVPYSNFQGNILRRTSVVYFPLLYSYFTGLLMVWSWLWDALMLKSHNHRWCPLANHNHH